MAVITSAGTGVSNTGGTWTGGVVPDATSDVVIQNTHTVTANGSHTWNSLTVLSGGTFNGNTETITLDGEADGSGDTTDGYAINIDGAISGSTTGITITTPATTLIDLAATSGNVRDLTINHASCVATMYSDVSLSRNLTITAGQLTTGAYGYGYSILTVAGDVSIASGGTLTGNTSAISLGSLTIAGGGTYSATSGTTTLTSEDAATTTYALFNDGGTFTHNNGKIKVDWNTPSKTGHTRIRANDFYDVEVDMNIVLNEVKLDDTSGNAINIYGDLTITQGFVEKVSASDTLFIHGLTNISANGIFMEDTNEDTNTITHHGLVTNLGEYKIQTGTNVKMNSGIRQLGTLTVE